MLNKFNIKISPACWQTETGAKTWPLDFLQPEFCCLTEVEYWSDLAGFIIKPNQETSDERGSKMSIIQINQCLESTKQQRNSNKKRYSSCFGETNNNEGNHELLCYYCESHLQFASFGIASPRTTAKHFLYWYWQPLAVGSNLMQQIFCQYIANTLPLLRHICDTWKWWCIHMFSSFCAVYMCFTNKSRMWNNQAKCKGLWIFMYIKEDCDKKQKWKKIWHQFCILA